MGKRRRIEIGQLCEVINVEGQDYFSVGEFVVSVERSGCPYCVKKEDYNPELVDYTEYKPDKFYALDSYQLKPVWK